MKAKTEEAQVNTGKAGLLIESYFFLLSKEEPGHIEDGSTNKGHGYYGWSTASCL